MKYKHDKIHKKIAPSIPHGPYDSHGEENGRKNTVGRLMGLARMPGGP